MSTQINTTQVRISSAKRKVTQRLFKNNIPGGNRNPIDGLGFNGLTINVKGYARTPEDYDTVVSEIFSAPFKLYLKDDWYYNGVLSDFNVPSLDSANYFPFDMKIECEEPYMYSDAETNRSKTITTNNQEWSADDDGFEIVTNGNVETVPDIQLTAGAASATFGRSGVLDDTTDAAEYEDDGNPTTPYVLYKTVTLAATANRKHNLTYVSLNLATDAGGDAYCKITYQAASLMSGAETTLVEYNETVDKGTYNEHSDTVDITAAENENLVLKWYLRNNVLDEHAWMKNARYTATEMRPNTIKNIQVYNMSDTTTVLNMCNELNPDDVIRINTAGNGAFSYTTSFEDTTFWTNMFGWSGATLDAGNNELDIADDGYVYVDIDVKYPITGIPILTSTIDITSGAPTIQISSDASTWYDIDTAIVDDVSTEYSLDSSGNLSLKGLTSFYFRFDCGATGTNTCSIKTYSIDVDIVTIDATTPSINLGVANTLTCDQDSASSLACEISAIYRDRKWT